MAAEPYEVLRLVQILCDAVASVMIFLIATELLPLAVAAIAGLLVSLSSHLSYYSLYLSPDSLPVLPLLVAVYLVIRASKRERLITVIAAGAMVGLSLWMRANALMLVVMLAVVVMLVMKGRKRIGYSLALVGTTLVVIAPITIRNSVVFHHFVPLSIGAGITLIEGIADYDDDGRFGMPASDYDTKIKDAEWHDRPDYLYYLWSPDGVERDQARIARGLAVIRSNPGWFLTVMLRRAGFMLRYNDSGRHDWPFGTAKVPIVSSAATFSHHVELSEQTRPVWSSSPGDLISGDVVKSRSAEFSLVDDGQRLLVTGDDSEFGDQLASTNIAVQKNTDYLLILPIKLEEGYMAAKVTTPDLRIALASVVIADAEIEERKRQKRKAKQADEAPSTEQRPMSLIKLPFASGDRSEVRLVISNNGQVSLRPQAQVGRPDLFAMGTTPFLWTRYPRAVIRGIQRNLYTTGRMLPLIIIGVILLIIARRWRALAILLAVPLYYMSTQSALHTEYRYILAIHYFLFIVASIALGCAGIAIWHAAKHFAPVSREPL